MKMQEDIAQKQYDFCASKLVSDCFAIYGAGKIGQQVYQKLKT